MDYLLVKAVHQVAVGLSISLFSLRAVGSLSGAQWPRRPPLRISQHLNDTVLLSSALVLAVLSGLAPWNAPWLAVKIAGLLSYIFLGTVVMRATLPLSTRLAAFLCALLVFAFIISVAVTRSAFGFFS